MKALSWNVRGLRSTVKLVIIKEVVRRHKIDILLIQETKLSSMNQATVTDISGNSHCSWISLNAEGSSGCILLCWNNRLFSMKDDFWCVFSLSAVLEDKDNGCAWIISSVYVPIDRSLQSSFWCELDSIRRKWAGPWCMGGDWNITRFPSERSGGGNHGRKYLPLRRYIGRGGLANMKLAGIKPYA